MLEDLLALIFPERCIGCNKSGSALCALCERTITLRPQALSSTTAALFDYQQPLVKKALWALKYHQRRALGKYFGIALYREFFKPLAHGEHKSDHNIILVPVPASAKAVAMRGYNHSAVIANNIANAAAVDGLTLEVGHRLLQKRRENKRQVEAGSRSERANNVTDVFAVKNGSAVAGKTVVLIDDVVTTGATLAEAKRAVGEWSPKRVLAVIVAH